MIYNDFFNDHKNWTIKLESIINKPYHLSGSGPAIFYIYEMEKEMIEIHKKIKGLKLVSYIAQTIP